MAAGERVVGLLPTSGRLYQIIQRRLGSGNVIDFDQLIKNRVIDSLDILFQYSDLDFNDATIVEIGTGWHLTDPLVFNVLGSSSIHTFDHIDWLRDELVFEALHAIGEQIPFIADRYDLDKNELWTRYQKLSQNDTLDDLLTNSTINHHVGKDATVSLVPNEINLFYSCSTLQRIPTDGLKSLLKSTTKKMADGGISYHTIHTKDYRSIYDSQLNPLRYLSYSDWFWSLLSDPDLSSQNRLRRCDFVDLFEKSGFNHRYERSTMYHPEKIGDIKLANEFNNYPIDEICIYQVQLLSEYQDGLDNPSDHNVEIIKNWENGNPRGHW